MGDPIAGQYYVAQFDLRTPLSTDSSQGAFGDDEDIDTILCPRNKDDAFGFFWPVRWKWRDLACPGPLLSSAYYEYEGGECAKDFPNPVEKLKAFEQLEENERPAHLQKRTLEGYEAGEHNCTKSTGAAPVRKETAEGSKCVKKL